MISPQLLFTSLPSQQGTMLEGNKVLNHFYCPDFDYNYTK